MRQTRQRTTLLRILRPTDEHPTALWLCSALREELPHVSLGTVYRLLDSLVKEGVVGEIDLGDGARRFDGKPGPHHHIVCTQCGRTVDVPELLSAGARELIAHWTGFGITGVRMNWEGLCPSCQASDSGTQGSGSERGLV